MSQVNYATMSDRELKRYFLEHRDDEVALQTYLDLSRERLNKFGTDSLV